MTPAEAPAPSRHFISRQFVWLLAAAAVVLAAVLVSTRSGLMNGWEYEKRLPGGYSLLAVDLREEMNISQRLPNGDAVGVISATVFAVGWNDEFIIAKQHARAFNGQHNERATNFYILRVSGGEVLGPLSAGQFAAERGKQALPSDLDFTLVLDDLE
jgi:hypothetical protein